MDEQKLSSQLAGVASPTTNYCRRAFVFRGLENGPEAVRVALLERGWIEFDEDIDEDHEWNIFWRTNRFSIQSYEQLLPWQRLNHFLKTTAITKKDALTRNMRRMQGVYGASTYNFWPKAFNLPNDYTKFVAEYSRIKQKSLEVGGKSNTNYWITKPADLSRGRGISIFKDLADLQYDCSAVVQQYITNPLLIAGYKFDLRIYVLVTSFNPTLTVYIYQEGLVRFSTEKYDISTLDNQFSHLTNTSINKLSPSYATDKERVGPGCKWTLSTLRNYFHQQNIDDKALWQRICNIITLTLLAQAPTVPRAANCFELFGFDVLIDDRMKPWVLEVNFSPALALECQADHVKKLLVHDIIELLNFKEGDVEHGGKDFKRKKMRTSQAYAADHSFRGTERRRMSVGGSSGPASSSSPRRASFSNGNKLPTISSSSQPSQLSSGLRRHSPSNQTSLSFSSSGGHSVDNDDEGEQVYLDENNPLPTIRSETVVEAATNPTRSRDRIEAEAGKKQIRGGLGSAAGISRTQREKLANDSKISFKSDISELSTTSSLNLPSVRESQKQVEVLREHLRSRQKAQDDMQINHLNAVNSSPKKASKANQRRVAAAHVHGTLVIPKELVPKGLKSSYANSLIRAEVLQPGGAHDCQLKTIEVVEKRGQTMAAAAKAVPQLIAGNLMAVKAGTAGSQQQKAKRPTRKEAAAAVVGVSHSKSTARPRPKAGMLVLTFPFNEATRRASALTLDMKTIIREVQKTLKTAPTASPAGQSPPPPLSLAKTKPAAANDQSPYLKWAPPHHKDVPVAADSGV